MAPLMATSFPGLCWKATTEAGWKTRPRPARTLYDEVRILQDSAWSQAGMSRGSDTYIRRRRISTPLQALLELPLSRDDERRCFEGTH